MAQWRFQFIGRTQFLFWRCPAPAFESPTSRMWSANPNSFAFMPSALFLAFQASTGGFDRSFHAVQAIELPAGATNISLLGLNMRDGLRLKERLRLAPR